MSDKEYKPPSWVGPPPPGLHLDVVKNGSVLQKLLVDEKPCYVFGRVKELCDFPLQHQSCSRQHAALVYHKHLKRPFLIDLGSTHGTFVGTLRLEPNKPTQLPVDTTISFGASTRTYTLREKPQPMSLVSDEGMADDREGGALLGLPELDNEVDDLTQYNTAHNRQISMVGISNVENPRKRKYRPNAVSFSEAEDVINPEDVDPSVGKYRNMIQTTIIPTKKRRMEGTAPPTPTSPTASSISSPTGLHPPRTEPLSPSSVHPSGLTSSLLSRTITAAPPVADPVEQPKQEQPISSTYWGLTYPTSDMPGLYTDLLEPKKKKYAKESWPGKNPTHLLV